MEAAITWGMTPFAFLQCSDIERAIMMAHFKERRLRKGLLDTVQSEVMDKSSKKGNSGTGGFEGYGAFGL